MYPGGLKRFDALVKNTHSDKAGIMAAWKIRRRVGRSARKAAAAPTAAPAQVAAAKAQEVLNPRGIVAEGWHHIVLLTTFAPMIYLLIDCL